MQKPYLLITGIPRSGTTLAASLVDQLEDTLCLSEPSRYYEWAIHCQNNAQNSSRSLLPIWRKCGRPFKEEARCSTFARATGACQLIISITAEETQTRLCSRGQTKRGNATSAGCEA